MQELSIPSIKLDNSVLEKFGEGAVIGLFGMGGSIGRRLCATIPKLGGSKEIVVLEDNPSRISSLVSEREGLEEHGVVMNAYFTPIVEGPLPTGRLENTTINLMISHVFNGSADHVLANQTFHHFYQFISLVRLTQLTERYDIESFCHISPYNGQSTEGPIRRLHLLAEAYLKWRSNSAEYNSSLWSIRIPWILDDMSWSFPANPRSIDGATPFEEINVTSADNVARAILNCFARRDLSGGVVVSQRTIKCRSLAELMEVSYKERCETKYSINTDRIEPALSTESDLIPETSGATKNLSLKDLIIPAFEFPPKLEEFFWKVSEIASPVSSKELFGDFKDVLGSKILFDNLKEPCGGERIKIVKTGDAANFYNLGRRGSDKK